MFVCVKQEGVKNYDVFIVSSDVSFIIQKRC